MHCLLGVVQTMPSKHTCTQLCDFDALDPVPYSLRAAECRGDIINSSEPTKEARLPNPQRLVKAYNQSAATLNLLRGFATGKARPHPPTRLWITLPPLALPVVILVLHTLVSAQA